MTIIISMILITINRLWILNLIINQIIIDVYKHMLIVVKHHSTCDWWDFRWLLLDDKSNPYIDGNQFSHKLVVGDSVDVNMMSH
jgi:hypothetical protein